MEGREISGSHQQEQMVPLEKYETLARKYDAMRKEYEDCLLQLGKARVKLRESKRIIKGWQAYVDRHPKYQEPVGETAVQADQSRPLRTHTPLPPRPEVLTSQSRSSAPSAPPPEVSSEERAEPREAGLPSSSPLPQLTSSVSAPVSTALGRLEAPHNSSRSSSKSHRNPSSQTTEGETYDTDRRIKNEPIDDNDEDVPTFVSARSIRRPDRTPESRKRNVWYGKRANGTTEAPFQIKPESSELLAHENLEHAHLNRMETSDLDAITGDMETPRKRRKLEGMSKDMLKQYQQTGSLESLAKTDEPPVSRQDDQDSREQTSVSRQAEQVSSRQSNVTDQRQHIPAKRTSLPWQERVRDVRTPDSATRSRGSSRGPLQPISTNTPTMPRTSTYSPGLKASTRSRDSRNGPQIESVAEDADQRNEARKQKGARNPRLDHLLEGVDTPEPRAVLSPRVPGSTRSWKELRQDQEPNSDAPTTVRRLRPPKSPRNEPTTAPRTRRSAGNTATGARKFLRTSRSPSIQPEHEPLRARPLHRLSLEDFKINPEYADADYAYTETIRGRDKRRCMPGCTRPECCGALNAFLSQEDQSAGTSSPSHLSAADRTLLESYLGPDASNIIPTLRPAARQDLVRKARAQKAADTYGKHRRQFERRTTPPGFWRTEFPSTQEERTDREVANKAERDRVEERWVDALRGGGRWKFRDE